MQKPRISPARLWGSAGRWQCRGGPMKHGEYLTGYGSSPHEAWMAFCNKFYSYAVAERRVGS